MLLLRDQTINQDPLVQSVVMYSTLGKKSTILLF